MSAIKIRAALEVALTNITPAIVTVWEGMDYDPIINTPYQQVSLTFLPPENPEMSSGYREIGIFNVRLRYPLPNGIKNAADRAELLRATFKRGASFVNNGVTVIIETTPSLSQGIVIDGRWLINVGINFYANIF
jgi:hypothetical protein